MTVFANKTPMRFSEKFLSFCGGMADKTTCGMYELTVYMNFRVTGIFGRLEDRDTFFYEIVETELAPENAQ